MKNVFKLLLFLNFTIICLAQQVGQSCSPGTFTINPYPVGTPLACDPDTNLWVVVKILKPPLDPATTLKNGGAIHINGQTLQPGSNTNYIIDTSSTPQLSVSADTYTSQSITSTGTLDWFITQQNSTPIHKLNGTGIVGENFTTGGCNDAQYYPYNDTNVPTLSWTDGVPNTTGSSQAASSQGIINGQSCYFMVTANASNTTIRTLRVFSGRYYNGGTLKMTAHMSDGSSADVVDTFYMSSGYQPRMYTISFRSVQSSAQLVVKLEVDLGTGLVGQGASLQ